MTTLFVYVIMIYAALMALESHLWYRGFKFKLIPECWMVVGLIAIAFWGSDVAATFDLR